MKLPDSLREQFKIPLGLLLPIGQDNRENIQKYLLDDSYIITVGDRTTEKMIEFGIIPSLQIIDGVDNASPGLNFALGNFLGASELDLMKVEIVSGASSAFYGPNAFNGVISMETKDPFFFASIQL